MFRTWSLAGGGAVQEVAGAFRCRTQWSKQIGGGITVKGALATCLSFLLYRVHSAMRLI